MTIQEILENKTTKPKEKTEQLSKCILDGLFSTSAVITYAIPTKDAMKATCIEAFEYATKINPAVATKELLQFATVYLNAKSPRVKWESAKLIGNIAALFPDHLEEAIIQLIANTASNGTVVRWSAAYALAEIIKTKHQHKAELVEALKNICNIEEKNSVKKIYLAALKKINLSI
jgi:hypothetical protein